MIVVDLEMSGLVPEKCGIFEIGAVDLESRETFFGNCRIDEEDVIINVGDKTVEEVTGRSEEQMRSKDKQSQKGLLEDFFSWIESKKDKIIVCHNFSDIIFLNAKARKYKLKVPYGYRAFDLHSVGHFKYQQLKGDFLISEGISDFGLSNLLEFVGMKDIRDKHNALEDAKLEAECFFRVVYGEGFFEEYEKFAVPDYLRKGDN